MNRPKIWRRALGAVLAIGIAVAFAMGAYHAGQASVGQPDAVAHASGYGWHGFFFAPFFFLFLLLLTARVLFWRGHGHGRRGCHYNVDRVPPAFEEWHRRAHEQQPPESSTK